MKINLAQKIASGLLKQHSIGLFRSCEEWDFLHRKRKDLASDIIFLYKKHMKQKEPTPEALRLARKKLAQLGNAAMVEKYSEAQRQAWRVKGANAMKRKAGKK